MPKMPSLNLTSEIDLSRRILPVRMMGLDSNPECGFACVRALIEYYGIAGPESAPPVDAHPDRMAKLLREGGLKVAFDERGTLEMLYDFVDEGHPVLVLGSAWEGCWRLVIGYEQGNSPDGWRGDRIVIANPEAECANISFDAPIFLSQWSEKSLFERPREKFWLLAHP